MKYAWIERHRKHWPVSLACEVLGVSPSGYHEHKVRSAKPRRNISDDALLVHICRRRLNFEPPRRPNIEPGVEAERVIVGCG